MSGGTSAGARRMTRRAFGRTLALGACGLGLGAVGRSPRSGAGRILVIGAPGDADFHRGARLGMEEALHAADLLGRPLEFVERESAGAGEGAALLDLAPKVGAVVAALASAGQEEIESAAAGAGVVFLDARAARPRAPRRVGVFRSGLPSTAYGLALLRVLRDENPGWRWRLVSVAPAPAPLRRLVERELGDRLAADGEVDAVVRIGAAPAEAGAAADGAAGSIVPRLTIDPAAAEPPAALAGRRALLWDDELFRYGAQQLNERFRRRFDTGMTGEAWAAWIALKTVSEAVLRTDDQRNGLARALGGERAAFDGHKGVPLRFGGPGGSLMQPLYVVGGGAAREVEWPWKGDEG